MTGTGTLVVSGIKDQKKKGMVAEGDIASRYNVPLFFIEFLFADFAPGIAFL